MHSDSRASITINKVLFTVGVLGLGTFFISMVLGVIFTDYKNSGFLMAYSIVLVFVAAILWVLKWLWLEKN
jgi:lipopolysaccharide export LptBFGC system permease protein LptF